MERHCLYGWNGIVYVGEEHLIELDTHSSIEETGLGKGRFLSAMFANIAVRRTGADPVNWLLGAAAAIGLAREADSNIVVDSTDWVNHLERAPDDFLKDILTERRPVFLAAVKSIFTG